MINVRDSEEFSRFLEALSNDIVDAHVHFGLYQNVTAAFERFPLVWQQSRVFWSQTLQAHLDSCVQALCRVYDQRSDSLHLRSWLSTIKQNLHLFDEANFRERLKDNPHVASLATLAGPPDQARLDQDLRSVSTDDLAVKRLTVHRGSRIAHRSARNVIAQRDVNDAYPLTFDDVEVRDRRVEDHRGCVGTTGLFE